MDFQTAVQTVFYKYADFSGRARRSEYWYFVLFVFLASAAVSFVGGIFGQGMIRLLTGLFSVIIFLPSIAVLFRRLHDTGRSGLWFLLGFIPLGQIVLIIFCCQDSQDGYNQYGPNPKDNMIFF